MNRGFTVVEVLITLVVIGILLGLGTVGLQSTLANGRDAERKADVETIARGLEQRYSMGNPVVTSVTNPNESQKGSYPSNNEMEHMRGLDRSAQGYTPGVVAGGYLTQGLPGTSEASYTNPSGVNNWEILCGWACAAVENGPQISARFAGQDKYLYEPLNETGTAICCCGPCSGFNIYWMSETDSTPYLGVAGLKVVRSKRQ